MAFDERRSPMGLATNASEEWQLLASVHPIFASKLPSVEPSGQSESDCEILKNFETIFEFEMWLLPDALQEAQACSLSENASQEGVLALASLLRLFEDYIDERVFDFTQEQRFRTQLLGIQAYPKLQALQYELKRRHENQSGNPLDHARDLGYLVWVGITIEGFHEMIIGLERFSRTVNRLSSSTYEDNSSQGTNHTWKEDELQSVHEAGEVCKNMNILFNRFVEKLQNCKPSHTAMVHLTGFRGVDMLLSSCSDKRTWRQIACDVTIDEKYVSSNIHLRGANRVDDFCAIIRGPRHKLLRIICSASEIWHSSEHSSEQILPVFKEHSRVTLLELLEERVRDRANAHIAPAFSKKKKMIVAIILARSLLKLVGGRWLQKVWNAESIFFLPDLNTGGIADLQMLYISCSLESKSSDESEMVDYEHYYPFIFAFGILLLELELDQRISVTMDDEEEADEDYPPNYMALLRIFLLRKEDLDDAYLLQIINSCLDFGNRVESIKHPSFNNDLKLRAAILRYIVQPLIQRLQAAHSEVSLDTLVMPQHPVGVKSPRTFAKYDGQSSSRLFAQEATTTYCPGESFSPKVQSILPTQAVGRAESISSSTRTSTPTWNSLRPRHRRDFKIAVICALPLEADAVKALFDERWDANGDIYGKAQGDQNAYSAGVIGRHNVVLAHMPGMGKESAASVAANCRSSFEGIKLALVVGICGGVPFGKQGEEILLGDVVISEGIIPYDFGRQFPDQFVRKDTVLDNLGRPNPEIRALLAKLKGRWDRRNLQNKISEYLTVLHKELGETATYPGTGEDKLFDPRYRHKHQISSSCAICAACRQRSDPICEAAFSLTCEQLKCDDHKLIPRHRLGKTGAEAAISEQTVYQPMVHFGLVASGNMVMKSGEDRDQIAVREDVIAFEMEGAGVWDNFPCLIIKGVCDYADSHKSKRWQNYAAATAAACMKAFLENWAISNSGP